MIIKALVENTSISSELGCEHGLSLYIETNEHKLLFDVGQGNLFLKNAKKLDVDVSDVDTLIISHGHNDHGGGLKDFLRVNKKAKVFLREGAFNGHFKKMEVAPLYIGLDASSMMNERFEFIDKDYKIDNELALVTNVTKMTEEFQTGKDLLMEKNGQLILDDFSHEQNLIITEGNNRVLITGCAHNSIVNIVNHVKKDYDITHVIGGFHLSGIADNKNMITKIAKLLDDDKKYYTCHCTGWDAYISLKDMLGEKIDYIKTGSIIEI